MISAERLAEILDGRADAEDWEVRLIAAELLARRAAEEQRAGLLKAELRRTLIPPGGV